MNLSLSALSLSSATGRLHRCHQAPPATPLLRCSRLGKSSAVSAGTSDGVREERVASRRENVRSGKKGSGTPGGSNNPTGRKRVNKFTKGRQRVPLQELEVGQKLDGRVRAVLDNAVIIKSRTETDAYLPEHAMGEFGPPSSFRPGMQVMCHITHLVPETDVLRVTMLKGGKLVAPMSRKAVMSKLKPGDVMSGGIKKILQETNSEGWVVTTGVFVDIGAQRNAYFPSDGKGIPPMGETVSVRILPDGLDEEQVRIRRRIGAEFVCAGEAPAADADDDGSSLQPDAYSFAIGAAAATAAAASAGPSSAPRTAAFIGDDLDSDDDEDEDLGDGDDYDKYAYLDDY